VLPQDSNWQELFSLFSSIPGARQIIVADIDRVQTSCGLGVPLYQLQEPRSSLVNWAAKKGEAGLQRYRQQKNSVSLDGLPTPRASQDIDK
jgi:hypothetical protein